MSIFRRSLHVVSKQVAYLIIILSGLIVLFIGALFWLSSEIEQRQDEISNWASEQTGYPVEVGAAGLQLLGFLPKLQLESVSVLDKNNKNTIVSLEHLYIGLDVLASIQQGEPVLNDVTLIGLELAIERDFSGQVHIKGLDSDSSPAKNEDWLAWIRILNRFQLQLATVDYVDNVSTEFSGKYQLTDAVINHNSQHWSSRGNIRLPKNMGQQLSFDVQADIDALAINKWQWQAMLTRLNLQQLAQPFLWHDIAIEQGVADIKLSARGQGTKFESLSSELNLSNTKLVSLREDSAQEPVTIEQLKGSFDWQDKGESWQLSGREIQLYIDGDEWTKTGFTIDKNNDGSWLVASNYLRLSDISAIASLSTSSPGILRDINPAGDIENLNFRYSSEKGLTALAFKLEEGVFEPWNNYPGVTGLTMTANWNDGLADIELKSHNLRLYAEKWLDDAVFFDSVSGTVNLQKSEKTWRVKSNELRVWNDDLTLQLDGQIEQQADGEIINDLKIKIEDLVVERWQDYVPQKILGESFQQWSNQAFKAGKIVDGDIEWVGKLSAFPYKNDSASGYFKMTLNVEDIQLHYTPSWPDLFNVTGIITGRGYDLHIDSQKGNIAGFDFEDVTTIINKLNEPNPILTVEGKLKGTSKKAIQFLKDSPLNERFGSAVKAVKMTGDSNISLELMVPLADSDATEVSGSVSFINSTLHHSSQTSVGLLNVNGQLEFDNNGVYADDINANVFNQTVHINVKPEVETTKISLTGPVAIEDLNSLWPASIPKFISGKTDYKADITVREKSVGDFYLDYALSSKLRGIKVDMPKPFTKAKETARALNATVESIDNELVYSINYGGDVNMIAASTEQNWRASLAFGEDRAALPTKGLTVQGKLAALSIDDWREWAEGLDGENDTDLLSNLAHVSMKIDKLTGFDRTLTSLEYSVNKDGPDWHIELESDQAIGEIKWLVKDRTLPLLDIKLSELSLVLPENESQQDNKTDSKTSLWPAMEINIKSFKIDDIDLGEMKLKARRNGQIWAIDSASLSSALFTANVVGKSSQWQQLPAGQKSTVVIQAESNNLAGLLTHFGYQQAIESESTKLSLNLSWPDYPLALSRENITGQLTINVAKGNLNDVEPGAAGRIFGLMSITALPRRLTLDFSDLFSSGFTFDYIKGDFNLANGLAKTDNLTLNGSAAKIEMTGTVDLLNKKYDQHVVVTPNVSSTLPLAGAVAGGPIGLGVGAALLVVDKLSGALFGKNIVNLISYKYDLTGPWDEPQLTVSRPPLEKKGTVDIIQQ